MRISKELYVGEKVDALGSVIYALRRNLPLLHIYCICKEMSGDKVIILSARELGKEQNAQRDYLVFGLAQGKAEAYRLFADIVKEGADAGYSVAELANYLKDNGVEADEEQDF